MGTLFRPWKRSWHEQVIGPRNRLIRWNRAERPHSCLLVDMKYKGLVDPKDKPFGRVFPFEVQLKIMFWVEFFVTKDKRKKLLQEFKRLPKCNVTGFPQHLGEGQRRNQVVSRLHAPRGSHCHHCHHCHRLIDHRLP